MNVVPVSIDPSVQVLFIDLVKEAELGLATAQNHWQLVRGLQLGDWRCDRPLRSIVLWLGCLLMGHSDVRAGMLAVSAGLKEMSGDSVQTRQLTFVCCWVLREAAVWTVLAERGAISEAA